MGRPLVEGAIDAGLDLLEAALLGAALGLDRAAQAVEPVHDRREALVESGIRFRRGRAGDLPRRARPAGWERGTGAGRTRLGGADFAADRLA